MLSRDQNLQFPCQWLAGFFSMDTVDIDVGFLFVESEVFVEPQCQFSTRTILIRCFFVSILQTEVFTAVLEI